MSKDWNMLKDREIINMMIGDAKIKNDIFIDYKMPYMRASDICEFEKKSEWMKVAGKMTNYPDGCIWRKFLTTR